MGRDSPVPHILLYSWLAAMLPFAIIGDDWSFIDLHEIAERLWVAAACHQLLVIIGPLGPVQSYTSLVRQRPYHCANMRAQYVDPEPVVVAKTAKRTTQRVRGYDIYYVAVD